MWSNWSHTRRITVLTVIGTIILLPIMIFVLGPNMPPGKDTNVSDQQVFDNTVLLAVMTPFAVFILTYLLYSVLVFRADPAEPLRDGANIRGHVPSQVAWLTITTITVIFLAIFGTAELLTNGSGGGQGPKPIAKPSGVVLPVQVIAQQWEFTYRYPTYGGVETPNLVIPVDRQIAFHVTSIDAIHSFWAYELGVKADANPGVDNIAYVKVKKTRTFQIRCAELCGVFHGYMYDTGRAVSASDFATWIGQQVKLYEPIKQYLPPYATTYAPDPQFRAG
jgi:cytochrome c oxidase subunit II